MTVFSDTTGSVRILYNRVRFLHFNAPQLLKFSPSMSGNSFLTAGVFLHK
jgi:hypothetical protein